MRSGLVSAMSLLFVACAGAPAPTEQIATSLAAVRGAQEAGAAAVPQAALHVKLAEEQLEKAQALMAEDENERAASLALRAQEDAELAIALARADATEKRIDAFATEHGSAGGERTAKK
jgi:hypothetical protein